MAPGYVIGYNANRCCTPSDAFWLRPYAAAAIISLCSSVPVGTVRVLIVPHSGKKINVLAENFSRLQLYKIVILFGWTVQCAATINTHK